VAIKGLEIKDDGIVHENEGRKVFEIFDDGGIDQNIFLARNERAFIAKKDGWLGDHYRGDWETYSVLTGEVKWFFEDMKKGERVKYQIKAGGRVKIPPDVAHSLNVKKGTIVIGRYLRPFNELKTNKHVLKWARKEL
jgi:hypothetical protein